MKIEELDNSKKKSKLLETVRGTTRPAAFFKPKIRIPDEPRIQKPKITDIETNWDFKPVPIAPPPLVPGTGPPPPLAPAIVPSLAHKPLKYPKFALAPDTVPVTIPYPGKIPMFNPDISGIKLPEPERPKMPEPERPEPERPDPAGSKWGAKGQGIGTGPAFPPIPPPWKDREPHAYPVPFAKDPVFTKPELEPELPDLDPGKLDLPGDKTEFDIVPPPLIKIPEPKTGPVGGPVPRLPRRRPYTDEIDPLHDKPMPGEKGWKPLEHQPGGEDPWPLKDKPGAMGKGEKHNVPVYDGPLPPKVKDQAELAPIESYADLSDKAKKVFWRVLKPGVVPNADMLKVHPHEWDGPIITVTKADGDQIQKTEPSKLTPDSSTLAPVNPEKGVDARDFWEGLGYSSLAQFEKSTKRCWRRKNRLCKR